MKTCLTDSNGFTLVELMVAISIIGIITTIAVPYYYNYKMTSCDQAALTDLFNVKAAVQKKMTDDLLSGTGIADTDAAAVGTALGLVLADKTGMYGFPGFTAKCGVSITNSGSVALVKAARGTEQGSTKGWALDLAGGTGPIAMEAQITDPPPPGDPPRPGGGYTPFR